MNVNPNIDKPIFLQIAEQLEDSIFTGAFPEETQIPSTNEISALLSINPHTVLKGMNVLVDGGIIYKKRGLGMFVNCLLYTSPSPRDYAASRMPSSA